jgi:hypothetical protein
MSTDDSPETANPARLIRDALLRELLREVADERDGGTTTQLQLVSRALVAKGGGGDVVAIREAFDRAAGKAPPAVPDADAELPKVTVEWLDHAP